MTSSLVDSLLTDDCLGAVLSFCDLPCLRRVAALVCKRFYRLSRHPVVVKRCCVQNYNGELEKHKIGSFSRFEYVQSLVNLIELRRFTEAALVKTSARISLRSSAREPTHHRNSVAKIRHRVWQASSLLHKCFTIRVDRVVSSNFAARKIVMDLTATVIFPMKDQGKQITLYSVCSTARDDGRLHRQLLQPLFDFVCLLGNQTLLSDLHLCWNFDYSSRGTPNRTDLADIVTCALDPSLCSCNLVLFVDFWPAVEEWPFSRAWIAEQRQKNTSITESAANRFKYPFKSAHCSQEHFNIASPWYMAMSLQLSSVTSWRSDRRNRRGKTNNNLSPSAPREYAYIGRNFAQCESLVDRFVGTFFPRLFQWSKSRSKPLPQAIMCIAQKIQKQLRLQIDRSCDAFPRLLSSTDLHVLSLPTTASDPDHPTHTCETRENADLPLGPTKQNRRSHFETCLLDGTLPAEHCCRTLQRRATYGLQRWKLGLKLLQRVDFLSETPVQCDTGDLPSSSSPTSPLAKNLFTTSTDISRVLRKTDYGKFVGVPTDELDKEDGIYVDGMAAAVPYVYKITAIVPSNKADREPRVELLRVVRNGLCSGWREYIPYDITRTAPLSVVARILRTHSNKTAVVNSSEQEGRPTEEKQQELQFIEDMMI